MEIPAWFWFVAAAVSGIVAGIGKLARKANRKADAVARELNGSCEECKLPLAECTCPEDEVRRPPTARLRLEQVATGIDAMREEVRAGFRLQTEATNRVDGRLFELEREVGEVKGGQAALAVTIDEHAGRLAKVELEQRALKDGPDGNAARAALASQAMAKESTG